MNIGSVSQPTDFTLDVLGRYVGNTFDEALANSDASYRSTARDLNGNSLPPRGDMRSFDFIVIGGGTFGGAVAEQLFYRSTGRNERILELEGGPFLLPEHWQNLTSMSLGGEVWGVRRIQIQTTSKVSPLRRRALDLLGGLVAAIAGFRDRHVASGSPR
jgi:hypothetical protein